MKNSSVIVAFAALLATTAFAQTPATAPATETAPATTAPTANATTAPASATAPTATEAKPKKPFKRPPGYRMSKRNGVTYYCRKDATIGSRVETTKCFTQEQLEELAMVNSESVESSQQAMRVCVNPTNCGGM